MNHYFKRLADKYEPILIDHFEILMKADYSEWKRNHPTLFKVILATIDYCVNGKGGQNG